MIDVETLRHDLALAAQLDPPFPADRFEGRGIVICAGGPRLFTGAWVSISILRELGCKLPIEVWHLGTAELGPPMQAMLKALGAEAVDAFEVARRHPSEPFHGWSLKSYAVRHSRFQEVMLVDADNAAARDPTFLFDDPAYLSTGALFWPDICRISADNLIWNISGLQPDDGPCFESGQMVIDKARSWSALCLADWLNRRSQDVYVVVYGDKDTFLIAWRMLDRPYALIPHSPLRDKDSLIQSGPDGEPLFYHRTNAKWLLRGRNTLLDAFETDQMALAHLEALRRIWDGWVFNPPPRSREAKRREEQLIAQRNFLCVHISSETRALELLADHRIGQGARADCVYWHVETRDDAEELIFSHAGACDAILRRGNDGVWRGEETYGSLRSIEVRPDAPLQHEALAAGGDVEGEAFQVMALDLVHRYAALPLDGEVVRDLSGLLRSLLRFDLSLRDPLTAVAEREGGAFGACLKAALDDIGPSGMRVLDQPVLVGEGIYTDWRYDPL